MTNEFHSIDLNCDLGEGGQHDDAIMPLISSANIACGGHAGDIESIVVGRASGSLAVASPLAPVTSPVCRPMHGTSMVRTLGGLTSYRLGCWLNE